MKSGLALLTIGIFSLFASSAFAVPKTYSEQLAQVRGKILDLEQALISTGKLQKEAKENVKRIQVLIRLQKQEREVGTRRLSELESTVTELESRRETLNLKIQAHQAEIRKSLIAIEASSRDNASPDLDLRLGEKEKLESPRRKLFANLTSKSLKDLEMLKIDLEDANHLEERIQDEKQQLAYLFQDLDEKESVLELNKQLQVDLIKRNGQDRMSQLENYRRLKNSEGQVEQMISDFNARLELERANETEKNVSKLMWQGAFAQLKGRLRLPVVAGKVISSFGKAFDPRSKLFIFKKGIDILTGKNELVHAISDGKVAFAGELPDYGRVAIIDHGNHYYSLCAHLGSITHKTGDAVAAGDSIGQTDDSGTPVYFEIRSRNVAVNPLQWMAN